MGVASLEKSARLSRDARSKIGGEDSVVVLRVVPAPPTTVASDIPERYLAVRWFFECVLILVLSPTWGLVLGLVALAVRLDSRGPILFFQERVGRHGRPFLMAKFRSMRVGADAGGAQFAAHQDPRVTRVGKFIRRMRLDELPQLWNVLRGEMSLIGPRPEQVALARDLELAIPCFSLRHVVRPGLTGWAQVNQGYAADLSATEVKVKHDLFYIANVSWRVDVAIVFRTLVTVLTGFGAR